MTVSGQKPRVMILGDVLTDTPSFAKFSETFDYFVSFSWHTNQTKRPELTGGI